LAWECTRILDDVDKKCLNNFGGETCWKATICESEKGVGKYDLDEFLER